ncbi:hypothetical protein K435DRAFT_870903 [Dendrothele bispora CBS 962.96]|uniref:Uncharacterized protein n=1 Tax=Dendrothele bispora (strain CBS 962.96) TaxID=1314807 RepID=A0A4S8L5G4_DENBC|nr:hypothetical protein K435DRAFT_870903 [Dendrothele bispora CBS 962.96]
MDSFTPLDLELFPSSIDGESKPLTPLTPASTEEMTSTLEEALVPVDSEHTMDYGGTTTGGYCTIKFSTVSPTYPTNAGVVSLYQTNEKPRQAESFLPFAQIFFSPTFPSIALEDFEKTSRQAKATINRYPGLLPGPFPSYALVIKHIQEKDTGGSPCYTRVGSFGLAAAWLRRVVSSSVFSIDLCRPNTQTDVIQL